MGDEDEVFESTDAGSSHTYPMEAGQIRKGGFIMIKGNPCKVSDVSTSKTGKHGHATSVPFVKKEEYQCIDVDEDDFVTLLTPSGDTRSDIKLPRALPPPEVPGADELSEKICTLLKEEKDFYVIVQIACGTEQIMDIKVMTGN